MDASEAALSRLMELARSFASMRGRTCHETMLAVLRSRTLRRHGYRGGGCVTQGQCDAGVALLEGWIRKAGGEIGAD